MLTKAKLAEFKAAIRKSLSASELNDLIDDLDDVEPKINFSTARSVSYGKLATNVYFDFIFADDLDTFQGCCGMLELFDLKLDGLSALGVACFALWLHQPFNKTGIVATTAAAPDVQGKTAQEKVLAQVGFVPVIRGKNGVPNGRGNFVTLWVFQTSKPAMGKIRA